VSVHRPMAYRYWPTCPQRSARIQHLTVASLKYIKLNLLCHSLHSLISSSHTPLTRTYSPVYLSVADIVHPTLDDRVLNLAHLSDPVPHRHFRHCGDRSFVSRVWQNLKITGRVHIATNIVPRASVCKVKRTTTTPIHTQISASRYSYQHLSLSLTTLKTRHTRIHLVPSQGVLEVCSNEQEPGGVE
jgi:hypothetical protein